MYNFKGECDLNVNKWNSQMAYIHFLLLSTFSVLDKEALIMLCTPESLISVHWSVNQPVLNQRAPSSYRVAEPCLRSG